MKKVMLVAAVAAMAFPVFTAADGALTSLGNTIAGEPCAIPIYHTDFAFPPEGGQIVQQGSQLFFVRTYLPGCSSGSIGRPLGSTPVISRSQQVSVVNTVPVFSAPVTGCRY